MNWKQRLLQALKILAPLALIAWLLSQLDPAQLEQLRTRRIDAPRIGGAFCLMLAAVSLSFLRWFLLVRALGLQFRLSDAFRLGFLGYLFNFVSFGSSGGDLFKAVFVAREQPGRRMEAVATVFVDRIVGLYGLIVVTTLALLWFGLPEQSPELIAIQQATYVAAGVGALGLGMLLVPGFTTGPLVEWLVTLPKAGPTIERVVAAVRMYRRQPVTLGLVGSISLTIHVLNASAVGLAALGLFDQPPGITDHLVIVPLANVAGALPFTPVGLGTYEFAMEKLYELWSVGDVVASGVLVALVFRMLTIGIAAVGVCVYWTSRREVTELLAEREPDEDESPRMVTERHLPATAGEAPAT